MAAVGGNGQCLNVADLVGHFGLVDFESGACVPHADSSPAAGDEAFSVRREDGGPGAFTRFASFQVAAGTGIEEDEIVGVVEHEEATVGREGCGFWNRAIGFELAFHVARLEVDSLEVLPVGCQRGRCIGELNGADCIFETINDSDNSSGGQFPEMEFLVFAAGENVLAVVADADALDVFVLADVASRFLEASVGSDAPDFDSSRISSGKEVFAVG